MIYGVLSRPGEYLETVHIISKLKNKIRPRNCTGVLIAKNAVLTARHCRPPEKENEEQPTSVVKFGVFTEEQAGEIGGSYSFSANVDEIAFPLSPVMIEYESLKGSERIKREKVLLDLALMKISDTPKVARIVKIASPEDTEQALFGRIAGYGYTEVASREIGRKYYADVNIGTANCSGVASTERFGEISRSDLYSCLPGRELVAGRLSPIEQDPTKETCAVELLIKRCLVENMNVHATERNKICSREALASNDELVRGELRHCADTCTGDSGGPLFVPLQIQFRFRVTT